MTGKYWEKALTEGVRRIFGLADLDGPFRGVDCTELNELKLDEKIVGDVFRMKLLTGGGAAGGCSRSACDHGWLRENEHDGGLGVMGCRLSMS